MRHRGWIICGEVFGDFGSGKTLPMDGHPQRVVDKRLRLAALEDVDVGGRTKLFDQLAGGIMIAINQVNVDARVLQPRHLLVEKQRRFKAFQADIVQIAGNDQEVNLLGKRSIDYFLEGAPSSVADLMYRSPRILSKPLQRGIEVDISAMDELHVAWARKSCCDPLSIQCTYRTQSGRTNCDYIAK